MTGVLADDLDATVPTDHLAVLADSLDAGSDLHVSLLVGLLVPVGDAASGEVVGRELHLDAIPGEDPDVVHPHLSRDVGEYLVAVLQFHPEHGVRQGFDDRALQYDRVFLGFRQGGALLTG